MIYSADALRKDTVALITQIDKQIAAVEARGKEMGIDPNLMQDSQGYWPMIPLLQAKAMAYNTLVMLQSGQNAPGRPRGGPPSRTR
jgi:hypothetical protein